MEARQSKTPSKQWIQEYVESTSFRFKRIIVPMNGVKISASSRNGLHSGINSTSEVLHTERAQKSIEKQIGIGFCSQQKAHTHTLSTVMYSMMVPCIYRGRAINKHQYEAHSNVSDLFIMHFQNCVLVVDSIEFPFCAFFSLARCIQFRTNVQHGPKKVCTRKKIQKRK